MTALEMRYRWLMRVYPAGHRAAYEEEMIGVLMAGAEPGRRFPATGDTVDLLRAGLTVRLGRAFRTQRGAGWRDAAAVTGLVVALVLVGIAGSRLVGGLRQHFLFGEAMRARGVDGLLLLDPAARALAWTLVVIALVFGLRRTAAGLAGTGLLVEAATVVWWWEMAPWQSLRLAWAPAMALLVLATLLFAMRARPVLAVVGAAGARWVAAAVGVTVLSVGLIGIGAVPDALPVSVEIFRFWVPMLMLAAAVWCAGPAVRSRAAALILTLLAVPFVFLYSWDLLRLSFAVDITPAIITQQLIVLVVTPVVVFAAGLLGLGARERFAARGRGQRKEA